MTTVFWMDAAPRYGLRRGIRATVAACLVWALAVAWPVPAQAQPAAQRISFADVAAAVVRGSLQLRAAALEVAIAEVQLAQARGGRGPQVSVTGSYTRVQEQGGQTIAFPNPFGPSPPVISFSLPAPDPNIFAARVALLYPLYTGGRLESQVALAEANLRGARAVMARIQQQLVFQAQELYLQALLGQEQVAAARRALDQARESLRVATARVGTGAAPQFDVLQANVAVATAEQGAVRARVGVAAALAGLNAALGHPQDTVLELADTLDPRPVPETLSDAIARGLRQRPELAEIQSRIAAAQAAVDLAASGARPNVAVSTGYDLGNANGTASSLTGGWFVTLSVTLLLHDGGVTRARVQEAQLRLEQLKALEADTRRQVELDIRRAWLALDQAAGELAAATAAVEQAREATRLAGVRYQAGVGTQLELLSAQASLAQAELALASARFSQNRARMQAFLATGALQGGP